MRYLIILILILGVGVAGCDTSQTPKKQPAEDVNVDEILEEFDDVKWLEDYDQALALAKERGLPVLINFSGSDWCSWCIKLMDEVFSKQEFLDYAKDNLVLLNLDFPRKKQLPAPQAQANQKLAERYGIKGFPTIVLLNKSGEEIGQTGYRAGGPTPYIEHLKQMLANK